MEDFIRRLDDRISRPNPAGGRIALAYSGGLASTIVALVARKRWDLECFVAGFEGSADLDAAESARFHLDLRLERVLLDAADARRIRDRIEAAHRLSSGTVRSLIPLVAVVEHADPTSWFAGYGSPRLAADLADQLRRFGVQAPLADASAGTNLPRSLLRRVARALGLPEDWGTVRHRDPGEGGGINEFV